MKKILMFLLLWTACLPLLAQDDGSKYTLQCVVTPLYSGSVNYSSPTECKPGQNYYLSASPRTGFKFVSWKDEGGEVISTESYFYYTMPERDVVLTAQFEYSPDTPDDPTIPEVITTYRLQTQAFPTYSGTTNYDRAENKEPGKDYNIYASARTGFKFIDWKDEEGNVVSNEYNFYYTMPERDVTLTAYFEYSPDTPLNPSRNYYDSTTKTLYIDDFETGNLYSVAYEFLRNNGLSKDDVYKMVVIGQVNSSDVSNIGYVVTSEIDLSRTTGLTLFNGIYSASTITSVILPESVCEFYYNAFSDMTAMASLTIYAYEPPTVNDNYITSYLDPEKVIVYVPASSLGLYTAHETWGKYTIMPITNTVQNVTVNLPEGVNLDDYSNCYIDLVNALNGQKLSYLVTSATSYTYYNILQNTIWNAYLRTADGYVLGEITGINVEKADVSAAFGELKELYDLTARVCDEDGHDLSNEVTVQWLTPEGEFVAQGPVLDKQPEGRKYIVRAITGKLVFEPVTDVEHTVNTYSHQVDIVVKKRPTVTATFNVTDEDGNSIKEYSVLLSQTVGKLTSLSKTVIDGSNVVLNPFAGYEASVKVTANGYIPKTVNIDVAEMNADNTFNVKLSKVVGTKLNLRGKARLATADGVSGLTMEATGALAFIFNYLNYTLVNKTTGQPITEFGQNGSTIALFDQLPDGTEIEVTASLPGTIPFGREVIEVDPAVATAIVKNNTGEATLEFVQRGGIMGFINPVTDLSAMLFDGAGNLVQQKAYQQGVVRFLNLADGDYTMVTMMRTDVNTAVSSLSRLDDMGLTAGVDYVASRAAIAKGFIKSFTCEYVEPTVAPEPEFLDAATTFTVNKSECVIGNYVTLNAQVRFNDELVNDVSNVNVVFDLQPHNSYVNNSCLIGSSLAMVTLQGDVLTVPVSTATNIGRIRFCTIPTESGTYTPSAFVKFSYKGNEYMKPIGSATFDAKSLDINVQPYTADGELTVRGMAPSGSTVEIYADRTPVGSTTALADGSWSARVVMTGGEGDHYVHAEVSDIATAPGAHLVTETKESVWDSKIIIPVQASFQFFNKYLRKTVSCVYDLMGCGISGKSYMFYTTAEYTFIARMTANGPDHLSQVIINAWMENGDVMPLEASYDPALDQYVATQSFNWGNLPVNLSVDWTLRGEELIAINHTYVATSPCTAKIIPIHDPSGYVYEAVGSNRLEGVTATAYYKEEYTDMYGDPQERVSVWEAEDYGQVNPQVTDAEGTYHWDVPQGLWQVKFEKSGYETTYSDWLPVPPPQMEINIPMQQLVQPMVKAVRAYNDQVEVDFSLYMEPSTLTTDSIFVTMNGEIVDGTIELVDEEAVSNEDLTTFASKIRFVPTNADALSGDGTLAIIVSKHVKAYNGLEMGQTFQQTLKAVLRPTTITVAGADEIITTLEKTATVTVLPAEAAAGKTLLVSTASDDVAKPTVTEVKLDANGQAQVAITAGMLGETTMNWQLKEADLSTESTVKVNAPKKGDVKIDDKVDMVDVATVLSIISGSGATGWGVDVNGDGRIDVADITAILNILSVKAE